MASLHRAARRALASPSLLISKRSFNDGSSSSSLIIARLINEPCSQIKATLDDDSLQFSAFRQNPRFPWRPLLAALASSSSPSKTRLVLEWRLEKMLNENEGNHERYAELVSLCGISGDLEFAMGICSSVEAHGIELTRATFNSLIRVCFSSGNSLAALSLFEIMERTAKLKPESDTFDAFIAGFSKLGNYGSMQAWFSAKKSAGFTSSLRNFESLVTGCIISGNFEGAERFYQEMRLTGVDPSAIILENMLEGFCKRRSSDSVKEFLKSEINCGWKISERTAEKIVGLYFELGKVDEMEELLMLLEDNDQASEALAIFHCGVVGLNSRLDRLDFMERATGRMLKRGFSFICPEVVENVICAYFRQNAYDRLDLFLDRIKGCYELARSTYDVLLVGYRRARLSHKVDSVINDMKSAGFSD